MVRVEQAAAALRSANRPGGPRSNQLHHRGHGCRIFVPRPATKQATISALVRAAPLFEKERHVLVLADSPDVLGPLPCHRARSWTAFAADDSPMDARQVNGGDWPKKRLKRDKPHASGHRS